MLSGMKEKISDLRKLIEEQKTDTTITIDGRTYLDVIPDYMRRGASTFVAGTSALFRKNGKSVAENYKILKHVIQETKEGM